MFPKDFPFLYEIRGGSLYISLSNGWFWIKCHLLIKMFLRLGNAGWYVVTKGRILFRTFSFCFKKWLPFIEFYLGNYFFNKIVRVASSRRRALKLLIFSLKDFAGEFVLKSLRASPFMSPFGPFSDPWWVAGREMGILESLYQGFLVC